VKVDPATGPTTGVARVQVVPAEARGIQGHRAGLITRAVANVVDLIVVFTVVAGTYIAWAGVKLLWQGQRFTRPEPGFARAFLFFTIVHIVYFTVSWATSGRTSGDQLMGLRVVSRTGRTLGLGLAAIRAVLCVAFPFGLLWAGINREHRSVQDLILRTSVIHDWLIHHTELLVDDSDDPLRPRVDVQPAVADEADDGHVEPLPRLHGE
jgi:uncharacterized RDD family membrane protein YckC